MPPPDTVHRFGDATIGIGELDGARHRLVFAGRECELEPKAFAVLVDLLAHAGELRSRDDLLDAVWGHRHVTPGVLSRCIAHLRKVLGDHAEAPRFIQTVHSLGYRFIAPVEGVEAVHAPTAPAPLPAPASREVRPVGRRVGAIAAGLAALAVLVGGVAWLSSRNKGQGLGEVVARPPTQVVLVPFTVSAQAKGIAPEVGALESAVLERLRMLPGLRVERGRADTKSIALTGEVVGAPGEWQLRVRLQHAPSAFDKRYPLQLKTLLDTAVGIQGDVVRQLRPDSADILEPSGILDAGAYVRSGLRAQGGLKRSDLRDAEGALRQALQLDPTNADAWCYLGRLYLRPAGESMASKDLALPPASEAIGRGLQLDPGSANCLASQGSLLRMQGRLDEAEVAYRRAMALEPTLYAPRNAIAFLELERGHFDRYCDALERIARDHPELGWTHYELIDGYTVTGQPGKGRALESLANERYPELRNVNWPSAVLEATYGHPADAIARYRALAAFDPEDRSYPISVGFTAASIGATDVAKAALDQAGVLDTPQYIVGHAWLFFALDDYAGASTWLRNAKVSPSLSLVRHALQAQSLALAGRREQALREYALVYEDGWKDEAPAIRQGLGHLTAQLLNYAALLAPGAKREDLIDAAARHLATRRANGFGLPWAHYQAAQIATMRGDRATAMRELDLAIDAGYTDVLSLKRDLPWQALEGDLAFETRRQRLASIARAQRQELASKTGETTAGPAAR